MVTAPMITPSVLPPLLGIITTVNAYHTILIIDKTIEAVQAHRRPFSSPEATINETIAREIDVARRVDHVQLIGFAVEDQRQIL